MNTEPELLASIIANPDDDTVRLAFADWCDENQQPERAEFIRLGIALLQGGQFLPNEITRYHALIRQHADAWLRGPKCERCKGRPRLRKGDEGDEWCLQCSGNGYTGSLAGRAADVTWRRGFPWQVQSRWDECAARVFGENEPSPWLTRLVNEWPVEEVPWVDAEPESVSVWSFWNKQSLYPDDMMGLVPDAIYKHLNPPDCSFSWAGYATREAAVADLARAVVLWAMKHVTGAKL